MNIATKAGLAVGSVSAALLLAACNPSTSASGGSSQPSAAPSGAGSASAPAPASASAPSAAASPSGGAATAGSGTGASGSASPGGGAAAGQSSACEASQLKIEDGVGGGPGAAADGSSELTFNLYSSSPCDMAGYPGVDLIGVNKATGKQMRFSLPRTGAGGSKVTVTSTTDAQFGILYAASVKSSQEFDVTEMIMTPPNTYTPMTHTFSSPVKIELLNGSPNAGVGPIGPGGHM